MPTCAERSIRPLRDTRNADEGCNESGAGMDRPTLHDKRDSKDRTMKRYLFASVLAVLAGALVHADDTGRASIRNADDTVPMAESGRAIIRTADSAPMMAPAGPVTGVITSSGYSNGGCSTCNCAHPEARDPRVGLHPLLSKLLWWKKPTCKKCGRLFGPRLNSGFGHGHGHGAGDGFNPYPNGVPGTLVFPQHPFVRSPRDFWMWEPK